MIELLNVTPFVDKLKLDTTSFGQRIFATVPDDDLDISQQVSPCAFVYVSDDSSEQNQMSSRRYISQRLTSHLVVEIVMRRTKSLDDLYDSAAQETLRQYRLEVFNALLGWNPDTPKMTVLQHVAGRLKKQEKTLQYADTFITRSINTGEHS